MLRPTFALRAVSGATARDRESSGSPGWPRRRSTGSASGPTSTPMWSCAATATRGRRIGALSLRDPDRVVTDRWAQWLRVRRDGGSEEQRRAALEFLGPIRDELLELPASGRATWSSTSAAATG